MQEFDQVLKFVLFKPAASAMQKINSVGFNLCHWRFVYIHLFQENHENRISRAGEKNSSVISLFFRKMDA